MNSAMTRFRRRAIGPVCLFFALTAAGRIASASGGVQYLDVWDDGQTVFAAMSMTQQVQGDSISANVTLTSPDRRVASADTGARTTYQVSAQASLPIDLIDGEYSANGDATEHGADQGRQSQPHAINPFIEIAQTSFARTSMPHQRGNASFTVITTASKNCAGPAVVAAGVGYPQNTDIAISIGPPDGDGTQQPFTALGQYTFAGGDTHQFLYSVTTGANNQVSGSATVVAYVSAITPPCKPINAPGVAITQTFTVN